MLLAHNLAPWPLKRCLHRRRLPPVDAASRGGSMIKRHVARGLAGVGFAAALMSAAPARATSTCDNTGSPLLDLAMTTVVPVPRPQYVVEEDHFLGFLHRGNH